MRLDSEKSRREKERKVGRVRSECSNIEHGSMQECAPHSCGGAEENSLCGTNAEQIIEKRNNGSRRCNGLIGAQAVTLEGLDANVMIINNTED